MERYHAEVFLSLAMAAPVATACSRAVQFGLKGQTITGRTMDWFVTGMGTNRRLQARLSSRRYHLHPHGNPGTSLPLKGRGATGRPDTLTCP